MLALALSLLVFLRLLLMIFKYSVYLVLFKKKFFSTQDCSFSISRVLINFGHHDLEEAEAVSRKIHRKTPVSDSLF